MLSLGWSGQRWRYPSIPVTFRCFASSDKDGLKPTHFSELSFYFPPDLFLHLGERRDFTMIGLLRDVVCFETFFFLVIGVRTRFNRNT